MEIKTNGELPTVLVCAPVSKRSSEVFKDWIKQFDTINYPIFDVMFIDNTDDNGEFFDTIKDINIEGHKVIAERMKWEPDKEHSLQMLANVRNRMREYALENNYDYMFSLDTDIFIPKNGIERLLSYNKDSVGFYVHIFPEGMQTPCLIKSGEIIMGKGVEFLSFKELNAYKEYVTKFREGKLTEEELNLKHFLIKDDFRPQLLRMYGVNLGCLMISRKVLEQVPFRTHPTFIMGEDFWFFAEANDKHFEFWCDTDIRAEHRNQSWTEITSKDTKRFNMVVAQGSTEATGIEVIKHV